MTRRHDARRTNDGGKKVTSAASVANMERFQLAPKRAKAIFSNWPASELAKLVTVLADLLARKAA
jgi:hypothetical protein